MQNLNVKIAVNSKNRSQTSSSSTHSKQSSPNNTCRLELEPNQLEPKIWYLHITEFSRISNALIIRNKGDSMKMSIKH